MKRSEHLKREFARLYIEVQDPFAHENLLANEVTYDEAVEMSDFIGTLLLGYVRSRLGDKERLLILGALDGDTLDPQSVEQKAAANVAEYLYTNKEPR